MSMIWKKMQRKENRSCHNWFRLCVLVFGTVVFFLPRFLMNSEPVYVISPWISLTCFLFYSRTIKRKRDWAALAVLILTAHEIRYFNFLGDAETGIGWISAGLLVLLALGLVLTIWLDAFYQKHGRYDIVKAAAFPVLRIITEWLIPGQQFNFSLTQFDNSWLLQSASVFGDVFLTFLVTLLPSVLVLMWLHKDERRWVRDGWMTVGAFGMIMLLGAVRLSTAPLAGPVIPMAYASGPQKIYYENPSKDSGVYEDLEEYLERSVKEAAEHGAKLIAYAEEAFMLFTPEEEDTFLKKAREEARKNHMFLLIGLDSLDEAWTPVNKAVMIDPEGKILSEYIKTNLIPYIETGVYKKGDGKIPSEHIAIEGNDLVISYTICYDATFAPFLLTMDPETILFVNPSWDWKEIVDLNYRLQGLSAVQAGVVLFKPTVDGWSIVTDPYGRVSYKEKYIGGDYDQVHYVDVPFGRTDTIYQKICRYVLAVWGIMALAVTAELIALAFRAAKAGISRKKN